MMVKGYITGWFKFIIWISFTILFFVTASYFSEPLYAFIGATISASIFLLILLINEYWLFPKYYINSRKKFIIFNMVIAIIITGAHFLFERGFIPKNVKVELLEMPVYFPILRSFGMVTMANFLSITLLLNSELKKKAESEKVLKEEKLGTELKLLKAQINPHFIFNALNNIYSLTYTKAEMAPDSVLKLSEMLRYVFYDCSHDHVQLSAEVDYISNFIAFQQMKSEHVQGIQFSHEKVNGSMEIAPMLFIPFIENAFKYSKIEEYIDAYVKIKISSDSNSLNFEIKNSIPYEGNAIPGNGMGINNVRQRLDLLYPNKHELQITDNDTSYLVNLKIEVE